MAFSTVAAERRSDPFPRRRLVNTPPPERRWLQITAQSRIGPPSADSRHLEVVVRLGWGLVLDVFGPHLICHVPAARDPVASCPQVLAPVALAQARELAQQLVRASPLQVLHGTRHRQAGRDRQQQMYMVPVD